MEDQSSPPPGKAVLSGEQFGAYKILSVLGKGGMGEVYRARDTKLGRDVAVKVLPPMFASDSDRVARFNREARLLAALNHSNIATIHSIEEHEGRTLLILELVEGETLADRLRRKRFSVNESLLIALQVAEGLEAAHEKGVIHRDLKPSNIQITTNDHIKVLDFGLAKIVTEGSDADLTQLPTSITAETRRDVLLGTPAYMSPEQARGQTVDRRTDIWAFGCILYEMLTGTTLFQEETTAGTLAKVLESPIRFDALPSQTPPSIVRLVQRCLQRDPRERLQHIGDARFEIRDVLAGTSAPVAPRTAAPGVLELIAGAAALVIVVAIVVWFVARQTIPEANVVTARSSIGPVAAPRPFPFGARHLALSDDGTQLVYKSGNQTFLRPMNRTQAVPIQSDSDVGNPFFSRDGKWIAFFAFFDLKKVSGNGGAATSIATFKGRNFGGTWGPDGTIVFSTEAGLFSVSDQGGKPKLLLAPDRDGVLLAWPEFIPDGRSLLFSRLPAGSADAAEIVLLDLKTSKSTVVAHGATGARYVPGGYLVYATPKGLEAIAFNPDTGTPSGDAVLIPDADVKIAPDNGAADFAVSGNGTLVQMPPVDNSLSQLAWVDLHGQSEAIKTIAPDAYGYPRVSPDGKRVAVDIRGPNRDLYVLDLERGSRVRISEGAGEDFLGVWSGDGRRLYYASNRGGFHVYSRAADGTGPEQLLIDSADVQMPQWLAPGNRLLFFKGPYEAADIGSVNLDHPTTVEWLLHSKYTERSPAVSPDGNWISYESDESGRQEVWVRPYPGVDKARIPIGAGRHARWSPRGDELYYRNPDGAMMAVSVQSSPEFHAGTPRLLFPDMDYGSTGGAVKYDVAPDGRFLVIQPIREAGNSQVMISVTVNWLGELKALLRH
jgi:serine/threonine-protein kinase